MSQSKLSKSKTKAALKSQPSTEILHRGCQRKIAQSEYIKIFPKMRLRLNARVNSINLPKNQYTEQFIWEEVQSMKEQNKKLEDINQELIAKIRKETKFNDIYEKKMEKVAIECMSFEKILEIKLLLEVEELEQELMRKEEEVEQLLKTNKRKKDSLANSTPDPYIELHAIMMQTEKEVEYRRQFKELQLKQTYDNLNLLGEKRQKLKNKQKQKTMQLSNTKCCLEKQSIISNKQEVVQQNNQNVLLGGINRTKNIEDLETEIEKIRAQQKELQIKVQREIDSKVRQKLLLMKEMQDCNKNMQKLKLFDKNRTVKVVDW